MNKFYERILSIISIVFRNLLNDNFVRLGNWFTRPQPFDITTSNQKYAFCIMLPSEYFIALFNPCHERIFSFVVNLMNHLDHVALRF